MTATHAPAASSSFEIRFDSLFDEGRALVFPCREDGQVEIDALSERYPYFRLRSALKPGLTGWAQIRHGYVNDVDGFEEKLALDLYYMKHRSFTMDLLILWKTAKTMVLMHGV